MALSNGSLDLFHLFFTMLVGVLNNGCLFLFSNGSSKVFNILELLLLFNLKSFLFLLEKTLVEAHDFIIVELLFPNHILDLVISYLLYSSTR